MLLEAAAFGEGVGCMKHSEQETKAMNTNAQNQSSEIKNRPERETRADCPTLPGFESIVKPFRFESQPHEYKVTALRECPTPEQMQECDTPDKIADYWRRHIPAHPYFNPECECFVALILNTRRRVKGHYLVSIGTMDTILVHPREVFRLAIMTAAASIVLTHNHPSGDSTPSEADIKVTRDLIRAGQLLKIEVVDHVVIGNPKHTSLRELGYFFQ